MERNMHMRVQKNRMAENLADGKAIPEAHWMSNCEPFASAMPITSKGPSECTFLLHRTHARKEGAWVKQKKHFPLILRYYALEILATSTSKLTPALHSRAEKGSQ